MNQKNNTTGLPSEFPLGIEEIKKLIPHRYPFLLVDKIISIEEGKIDGIKGVTANEPFFQGHFPTEAVMPGVLQIEAMAQLAACYAIKKSGDKDMSVYLLSVDKAKFRKKVVPGDQLNLHVEILKQSGTRMTFKGQIFVDDKLASEAELFAIVKTGE